MDTLSFNVANKHIDSAGNSSIFSIIHDR